MNEQERQQFQEMQRQLNELMAYKRNKEIQQISYPLDEVSRTIINQAASNSFVVLGNSAVVTIASGAVTATSGYVEIDTEGAAATDDLDTISVAGIANGSLLLIQPASGARTVVVKDGTGNLRIAGDFTMDNSHDTMLLIKDTTSWYEVSRSDNGA